MSVVFHKTAEEAEREGRKEYYRNREIPGWQGPPDRYVVPVHTLVFPLVRKVPPKS